MAQGAILRFSGEKVPIDASFFTEASGKDALSDGHAQCRSTQIPLSRVKGKIALELAPR
jgi:hypothetical protein